MTSVERPGFPAIRPLFTSCPRKLISSGANLYALALDLTLEEYVVGYVLQGLVQALARAVTGGRVLSTEEVAMGRLEEYFAAWARARPNVRTVLVVGAPAPTTLRTV